MIHSHCVIFLNMTSKQIQLVLGWMQDEQVTSESRVVDLESVNDMAKLSDQLVQ